MSARGEGTIELDDREVTVLFTNRALANAEKDLGQGVIGVAQSFQEAGKVGDVAILLRHGMEAARRDSRRGGRPVSMLEAYEVLDEVGFATVAAVVMEGVAAVLGYSPDEEVARQNGQVDDPNE